MISPSPVRPGIADRLSRLIQLRTVEAEHPDADQQEQNEAFAAFPDLIADMYPGIGAQLQVEEVTERGFLYRWVGTDSELDPVVLMAHFDVVPADQTETWTHPPFSGSVDDNVVYGRGALDDKGPLIVVLESIENLLSSGYVPTRDVYLSFGGDEETTGDAAQAIAAAMRAKGVKPWLVLDEGGAVVDAPLPGVEGKTAMVGVGEKGFLTVRLSAADNGGHASAPPRNTSITRLARAVTRLKPAMFPARTPPTLTRMIRILATQTTGRWRLLYTLLGRLPPVTAKMFSLMGGEAAAMVRTTIVATQTTGGVAANVLPPFATATFNIRIAIGETVETTIEKITRRVARQRVHIEVVKANDPSPASRIDTPQFSAITTAISVAYPSAVTAPYIMMASTDARYFHQLFDHVYRFAPLTMTPAQRASIHGADEHVTVDALERGELFHRELILAITQPATPPCGSTTPGGATA